MKKPETAAPLLEGGEIELSIEKLAFGGKALGRVDGFVVFVEHALPGQKVRVRVTRVKPQFAEARVVQVLGQSPAYELPFCPHFGLCGGCQWQDLNYAEQLRWKGLHLEECLRHLGGFAPGLTLPAVASPEITGYRNKMEFTFASRPSAGGGAPAPDAPGGLALGLHVWSSSREIFNLEHCFLGSAGAPLMVQEVRSFCRQSGLPAYNPKTGKGFWRFLVFREGKRTGQTLAHLITTGQGDRDAVAALAGHLRERFPDLTTLVHSRSRTKAQIARGEHRRTLWGPGYIEERLGELRLRVSAESFLQPNTLAAEGLYDAIRRLGEFTGRETVWDLYCGAGSIGLFLAPRVQQVVGFELDAAAVKDAVTNSRLNGLSHCRFLAGDLKERLREAMKDPASPPPEVVIADPPRSGLHPEVVTALLELAPPRLIYVSCNPATLARDLALLKGHYEVTAIQPFDFFPHTPHIEGLVRLDRRPQAVA
jgi:23S rRNA (uracil1939-C5)-methyltransferase